MAARGPRRGIKAEGGLENEEPVGKACGLADEAEPDGYLEMEERVREVSNFQDIWKYSGLRLFL